MTINFRVVPIRAIATEVQTGPFGSQLHAEEYVEGGIPVINPSNIRDGELFPDRATSVTKATANRLTRHRLVAGDLIFARRGELGRAAVVSEAADGWLCGTGSLRVRLRPDSLIAPYVRYVLQSSETRSYFERQAVGSTMENLNTAIVLGLDVPMPEFEEQRRIADFLDGEVSRLDSLAAGRRRQIDLFRQRLMGIWSQEIEDASDSWAPLRRFLLSITDGPFGSALTSGHYSDTGARVIRLGNVGLCEFRSVDEAYIPISYFLQLRKHEALPGDLVVAGLGDENHPLGRACVLPGDLGPAIVKADCFRLRLDQRRLNHEYAALAISSPVVVDQTRLLARGSTRSRINLEVVRDVRLPIPSIRVQMEIVGRLRERREESRRVIEQCRAQLALLAERRQALITAAVTGQIDVTTAREVTV